MTTPKDDIIKDYGTIAKAGRKDWQMMLESKHKKNVSDHEKNVSDHRNASRLGQQTKDVKGKVIHSEIDKLKYSRTRAKNRNRDKTDEIEIKENGAGTVSPPGNPYNNPGSGTVVDRLGVGITKRNKITEDSDDVVEDSTDPKIKKIESKREKLEKQLADLEQEKLITMKLAELAAKKAELEEQLSAIKDEIADVKSGKEVSGETHDEGSTPEEHAEHEAEETPAEEAAEDDEEVDAEIENDDDADEDEEETEINETKK